MRFIPRDKNDLIKILDGQPGQRKVEADPDTNIAAKTVDDLRALSTWHGDLVVTMPKQNYPESTVKVSRAGH